MTKVLTRQKVYECIKIKNNFNYEFVEHIFNSTCFYYKQ